MSGPRRADYDKALYMGKAGGGDPSGLTLLQPFKPNYSYTRYEPCTNPLSSGKPGDGGFVLLYAAKNDFVSGSEFDAEE
ncbi:hypothetical protein [Treponema endosymbiont of Eucomonympha sp.]|uniref:hypothetical protein n=1 Tax=Treponema endosymbiont of Eucomonympha sp. TaxID=1580831 RepID=UPI000750879C|nr:hypothetical protein [Treponema endosymbiont of Eucomonympha sp.]